MLKNRLIILFLLTVIVGITGFVCIEKKSFAKGLLGKIQVNIVESNTVKNHIDNSFGSGPTQCIESYNANLETQNQDTMIVVGVIKNRTKGDCSIHTSMTEIFKKESLPFNISGSGTIGKFASLTVKIKDKFYISSLKAQPAGSSFSITAVVPIQPTDEDLLRSYKNFYRVDGIVTGRLYSAVVDGDFVDVKGFTFSSVFAERK